MIQYTHKSFLICQKDYMLLYHQKIINSILKVPIVAHNARHYYLIFLLKNKRGLQRKKENFELKYTVVINIVVLPR